MQEANPIFHHDIAPTSESAENWHEPVEGFQLKRETLSVPQSFQEDKLRTTGIDPALFSNTVDPSLFVGIGIESGIRSGISAEGNLNMVQRLVQHRPVQLGEVLTVQGQIDHVHEVPRGHTVETTVTFQDQSGTIVIDASRKSLKPNPDAGARRGAGERPPPVIPDPSLAAVICEHQLSPERVTRYLADANSIHYDEEAAQKAGFRAPMIAGGMGVHFLTALLWSTPTPHAFDLDIYFRRPIFWDERFVTAVLGPPETKSSWSGLCLLRDEEAAGLKVLTEARIRFLKCPASEVRQH